jgi:aminoglycoside phosphotransferase (APT) family kinase protein
VGLGDLGKPEGYVERQINAWGRSWAASVGPAGFDDPRAYEVEAFLRARLPGQVPARVVHGDFGIHNILVGRSGGLLAVIDWEIATLGDPLADLAYALNPWPDPSDPEPPADTTPHAQPGFPTRTELAERYAAATGADLSGLNYYVAFNRWKSACIVHGVYARYMEGKKSTEGVDTEGLRMSVLRSLELAARAVRADPA